LTFFVYVLFGEGQEGRKEGRGKGEDVSGNGRRGSGKGVE